VKVVGSSLLSYFRALSYAILDFFHILLAVVCFGFLSMITYAEVFPHDNCGVNSALVVLLRFNHTVDKENILSSLNVGADLSNATSFASLAETFTQHNLHCYAFKKASIVDVTSYLGSACLAIIQTHSPPFDHLLVVSKRGEDSFVIDDFPHMNVAMSKNTFTNAYTSAFTGNVLFVSRDVNVNLSSMSDGGSVNSSVTAPVSQERTDILPEGDKNFGDSIDGVTSPNHSETLKGEFIEVPSGVDMGRVSSRNNEIRYRLNIVNKSNQLVIISSIKGSCSCFLGVVEKSSDIKPNRNNILTLRFNPSGMTIPSSNQILRSIVIQTSDPKLPVAKIEISGRLVSFTDWGVMPPKIELGSLSKSNVEKLKIQFNLFSRLKASFDDVEILPIGNMDVCGSVNLFSAENVVLNGDSYHYGNIEFTFSKVSEGRFSYLFQIKNKVSGETQSVELKGEVY